MALSKIKPGQRFQFKAEAFNALVDLDAAAKATSQGDFEATHASSIMEAIVVSSAVDTANQRWKYQIRLVGDAPGSSDWTYQAAITAGSTFEGRNAWETLSKAGYSSTVVTGLKPIPDGAPILGRFVQGNGVYFFRFRERNEAVCST